MTIFEPRRLYRKCPRSLTFPPAGLVPLPLRLCLLVTSLACISCSGGESLHPVEGKVLYKNEPAKGVVVTFHPRKAVNAITVVRPMALTEADGTFRLTTGQKDGAAEGEYVVTLTWPVIVEAKGKKGFSIEAPETRDRFGGAYAVSASSPFKATVQSGTNTLEPFRPK
ncbi:MAG: hypothetical protein IT429_26755 [Gemmataceae bacterium]|nr:hypothetical protein [Gemmataceae bacterium]